MGRSSGRDVNASLWGHNGDGISHAFSEHSNMRIHLLIGSLVILASFYMGFSKEEVAILIFIIALVIITEMLNTAIESMTNLITTEHRQHAKIAKDVAAGMVLLSATIAVLVGLIIFVPKLISFFR